MDISAPSDTTPPLSTSGTSSVESSPMSNFAAPFFIRSETLQTLQFKGSNEERRRSSSPHSSSGHDSHDSVQSTRSLLRSSSQPPSPHASRSSTSSPSKTFREPHPFDQYSRTFPRYRPYPSRVSHAPREIRFAERTLDPSSHFMLTMDDVQEGKDLLVSALKRFPDEVIQKAYEAKRADRDSIVHQVAQTAAKIESLERHRQFLFSVQQNQESLLAVEEALLIVVKNCLSRRSLRDVEDDNGYYRSVFAEELSALAVADLQMEQVESISRSASTAPPPGLAG